MFQIFSSEKTFDLEYGGKLYGFEIGFSTYGKLNVDKSNVIWACHGLTGNSKVLDWWGGLFGQGCLFNEEDHFIISANVLGSCYGSTNPLSINQITGDKYYHDFPDISIRDMVNMHIELAAHLDIDKIQVLIGGSLGGQQAVEWAIMQPNRIANLILISSNAYHSPWGIAFSEAQRMAIKADPTWTQSVDNAGQEGLKAARAIGVLSYRNYNTFANTQLETDLDVRQDFKASLYQQHQGVKFINRFNLFSYLTLMKASDAHQVGRGRKGIAEALSQVVAKTLIIGIKSDLIFPLCEQEFLYNNIKGSKFEIIDSLYGHDGFIIETVAISKIVKSFLVENNLLTVVNNNVLAVS